MCSENATNLAHQNQLDYTTLWHVLLNLLTDKNLSCETQSQLIYIIVSGSSIDGYFMKEMRGSLASLDNNTSIWKVDRACEKFLKKPQQLIFLVHLVSCNLELYSQVFPFSTETGPTVIFHNYSLTYLQDLHKLYIELLFTCLVKCLW